MNITDIKGGFTLNNGVVMPYLGLGVWQMHDGKEVISSVEYALEAGYRHIDTATLYQNEAGVGTAIKNSGVPRNEIFVTTKVINEDQGYNQTLTAFQHSLELLQTDYIDLYLIHWPVTGKFLDTWRAFEEIYNRKLVKAIGVSNFLEHHLNQLLPNCNVIPAVNQFEFHPHLQQPSLVQFCKSKNIQSQAWSPIIRGEVNNIEAIKQIGIKYNKTPVQVTLRWELQKGIVTIPKSVHKDRIVFNAQIFDFSLSDDDMKIMDRLDCNGRTGLHPDIF